MVALALGTRWNLYVDRFLVTPAALTCHSRPPCYVASSCARSSRCSPPQRSGLALAYDLSKPTGIWNRGSGRRAVVRWPELKPVLETVQARVPADARLGVDLAPLDWEYPWWGPRLERRLVWLPEQSSSGVDWVLLGSRITTAARRRIGARSGSRRSRGRCSSAVSLSAVDFTARIVTLELARDVRHLARVARHGGRREVTLDMQRRARLRRGGADRALRRVARVGARLCRGARRARSATTRSRSRRSWRGCPRASTRRVRAIDAALHDLQGKLVGRARLPAARAAAVRAADVVDDLARRSRRHGAPRGEGARRGSSG